MGRQRRAPPSPTSAIAIGAKLGYHGVIRVLFETPSGFAIFAMDGVRLLEPGAIEAWLKDFQFFGDKSDAINPDTGVNDKLSKMLQQWCGPGQKLAVGKAEYKTIIEACLGITCLYGDFVMEVMWGLKNLMYSFVPEEKSQLTKVDRLQMSVRLKMVLNRHGFDVKPEMVSDPIILAACYLHDCDFCDNTFSKELRVCGKVLEDVSHINCEGWDLMKLATALKMIFCPDEEIVVDDPREMFSPDELSKLLTDAPRCKDKLIEYACLRTYDTMAFFHKLRIEAFKTLGFLIKEAEQACQAGQGDDLRSWGLEKASYGQEQPSKRLKSQN